MVERQSATEPGITVGKSRLHSLTGLKYQPPHPEASRQRTGSLFPASHHRWSRTKHPIELAASEGLPTRARLMSRPRRGLPATLVCAIPEKHGLVLDGRRSGLRRIVAATPNKTKSGSAIRKGDNQSRRLRRNPIVPPQDPGLYKDLQRAWADGSQPVDNSPYHSTPKKADGKCKLVLTPVSAIENRAIIHCNGEGLG
jgi:hypothetical protein